MQSVATFKKNRDFKLYFVSLVLLVVILFFGFMLFSFDFVNLPLPKIPPSSNNRCLLEMAPSAVLSYQATTTIITIFSIFSFFDFGEKFKKQQFIYGFFLDGTWTKNNNHEKEIQSATFRKQLPS